MNTTAWRRWHLLGVPLSGASLETIVAECVRPKGGPGRATTVACANLHCVVTAQRDAAFLQALRAATFVTSDGAPLPVAGRLLGEVVGPRITGADAFHAIMAALNRRGARVLFLGSTPTVLDRIRSRAAQDYPAVAIAVSSPPFRELAPAESAKLVASINAFRPNVVWVGMSAPRQDIWAAANASSLDTDAVLGIGAVFDFYAGTVRRAPVWMRRLGLEWLYRLLREPRRLWRRYLISGPVFVSLLWRDRKAQRSA